MLIVLVCNADCFVWNGKHNYPYIIDAHTHAYTHSSADRDQAGIQFEQKANTQIELTL
jgi:hypothetical protein